MRIRLNRYIQIQVVYMIVYSHFHLLGMRKTKLYNIILAAKLDKTCVNNRVQETSKIKTAFRRISDRNYLESKLLKQLWAPFCNLSGAVLQHLECNLIVKKSL